jgi:cysteine desulfurase / selenocysteine lyase
MRIYLDNAATTWPKPESVYQAVDRAQREWGVAAGRGASQEALSIQRMLLELRQLIAQLINGHSPAGVTFHAHGTAALNTAIHGLIRQGQHVICTAAEHNSVLRPLETLAADNMIEWTILPSDQTGRVDPIALRKAWRTNTSLFVCNHASNVTGVVQDVAALGAIVRERNGLFLLDAAQTLGHLPIDVAAMQCDLLAGPGHKGLLGPLGTGVLYLSERAMPVVRSTIQGGTGSKSESLQQPWELPDRLEPGNLNVPGLAGLHAGVDWIMQHTIPQLQQHQQALNSAWQELWQQAELAEHLRSWGADSNGVGVVSLLSNEYDSHELATILDQLPVRVQGRAGLHCAPLMHQALGTAQQGGTFRLSWGPLTQRQDLELAIAQLASLFR